MGGKEMKLIQKLKDRHNIFTMAIIAVFLIISFRLASLTIVHGDELREISDTKRVRKLPVTAQRGEIRDRYGRLLAGNRPSFTVQVLKDEINVRDIQKRNKTVLQLVKLLEEDGVNYTDEFPIIFNTFRYKDENDYLDEEKNSNPSEKVLEVLIDNNLFGELLDKSIVYDDGGNSFDFMVGRKAISIIEARGYKVPILIDFDEEQGVNYYFDKGKDIERWKKDHDIPNGLSAKETILYLIDNDITQIRKILNNSNTRLLVFNMLSEKNLIEDIELIPYSFTYDNDYKNMKRSLIRNKDLTGITMDTTTQEDFINIVLQTSIDELLGKVIVKTNDKGKVEDEIIPGKMVLDKLEEMEIVHPLKLTINEEKGKATYQFTSDEERSRFFRNEEIETEMSPMQVALYLEKEHGVIGEVIIDDKVKGLAQELMLNNGFNPRISIATWEYVEINNKNNWLTRYRVPEEYSKDPKKAFEHMRGRYRISEDLNEYEARAMMTILEQINNQGYRAFQPINLAYGIKDSTVAKIEENKMDLPGVQVSIEPVRYYPLGESAAHILGYLGKISQPWEIQKYIEENNYLRSDIIGKTGVELWFEDHLKGIDGSRHVEVDVMGNTTKVLFEEKSVPGDTLYLTIDAKLQKVAEDALKHALEEIQRGGEFQSKWGNYKFGTKKGGEPYKNATSGSVVAIDVKTGQVLALANYPSYDPSLFATGISWDDWQSLQPEHEEDHLAPRPLYNIALQSTMPPGSTFKMITGLAGLEKGIKATTKIYDYGYIDIGGSTFGCWIWNQNRGSHGWEDLYDAIADSCNYYFFSLTYGRNPRTGQGIGGKVEVEDIFRVASEFGLNERTGVEISGERSGRVPNTTTKTSATKGLLKRFLNQNIKYHIDNEDILEDDKKISNIVEEIVSWVEYEVPLSRNEVIRRLADLDVEGERVVQGKSRTTLADIIKYDYLNQAGWKQVDSLNISIGQGENAYTPIQMANYIATLANGGYRHRVSIADKVMSYDNGEVIWQPEREATRVTLNDYRYLDDIKKGMVQTSTHGTARSVFGRFPVTVASKTGTAQNTNINPVTKQKYDGYANLAAFAPAEDPQIAVYVSIYQGGSGGYAAPIAREIIAQYLGLNDEDMDKFTFKNKIAQ